VWWFATVTAIAIVMVTAPMVAGGLLAEGWFGWARVLMLEAFAAYTAWAVFWETFTMTDLGSVRAARRQLRHAQQTGSRRREKLAKVRIALIRFKRRR
jgi:hypothetical protein